MLTYLISSLFLMINGILVAFGVWIIEGQQHYDIAILFWAIALVLSVFFWEIFLERLHLSKREKVLIAVFPIMYGVLIACLVVIFKQLMFLILAIALMVGAGYLWCLRRCMRR